MPNMPQDTHCNIIFEARLHYDKMLIGSLQRHYYPSGRVHCVEPASLILNSKGKWVAYSMDIEAAQWRREGIFKGTITEPA